MAGGRADWDDKTTKIFLDLCIAEKKKHNYHKKGLTKQGWQNIYRNFRLQTGRAYASKQLQNKFNTLKRTFRSWRKLKNKSGPGWDQNKGTITETPQWWAERIAENSAYEQFRNRGLPHEDELITLFGSVDSEDGPMLCTGGLGDRTPSGGNIGGLPDDNAGWSEDNVGRSIVGRVAQRSGKKQVVDSPPAKKSKSIEYYAERISESMLQRCKNKAVAMTREQEEVTDLLQIVEEDGVSLDSELYFIATELLMTATRRAAFRRFTTAEQRIAWLQWTWDNVKKN
ncbi:hypothetical protein BS78_03G074500 [Paspalum vaginatum]|nr:hypothetical protein BS78_03G074500 [Paspalum vaginatum]KAJ1282738.1 hypothetical protein BS78_03G074500 [Paspalum vaginatum]